MIEGGTILAAYIVVNVLLLLALLLFMTGRLLMSSSAVDATFTQQRRFCQMVLLATFVAPLVVMGLSVLLASPLLMPLLGLIQPDAVNLLDEWPIIQALTQGDVARAAIPAAGAPESSWIQEISQSIGVKEVLMFMVAAGALVVLIRFVGSMLHLWRVIADSVPLRRLGRVAILVSDSATVPFSTMAFGKALVILPTGILRDARDTDIAIRHELQHHRQHDTLWALVVELFKVVFVWNPAFYLWRRQLSQLQELSCDEELIRKHRCSANDYGGCLLRVAQAASPRNRRLAIVGIVAMTAGVSTANGLSGLLHMRVERLFLHGQPDSARWFVRSLYLGVLIILLAITQLAEDSRLYLTGGVGVEQDPVARALNTASSTLPAMRETVAFAGRRDERGAPLSERSPVLAQPVLQEKVVAESEFVPATTAVEASQPPLQETRFEDIPALARTLEAMPVPAAGIEQSPFNTVAAETRPLNVAVVEIPARQADAATRFASAAALYNAREFETARDQFTRLAGEGHHNAQFNLGLMHYRGEGMEQDLLGAYAWIRLSALDGDGQKARVAEVLRTMLGYRLTQKGDALAQELQPGVDLEATADFNYSTDRNAAAVAAADEMRKDIRKMGRRTGSRLRSGLMSGSVIVYDRYGMNSSSAQLSRVPGG
jgi:hypothetical protein